MSEGKAEGEEEKDEKNGEGVDNDQCRCGKCKITLICTDGRRVWPPRRRNTHTATGRSDSNVGRCCWSFLFPLKGYEWRRK